uniref:Reverse transcriptase domain-containing protein n=1 Tax=Oryzias melastigma TaxID=30732 RepID=A0A3B3DCY4_ORYME
MVGTVFLDLSAAFDLLDHELLINKLNSYGFETSATEWIKSYLDNRSFTVLFNGSYSEKQKLCCGVPQGSCLGPLLFSIFMNDLPFVLKHATIALYADDSTIYMSGTNAHHLSQDLNDELRAVENWFNVNRLVINAEKTKCMMLGSSYLLKDSPVLNLSVSGSPIEQVSEAKLLGVVVDSKMTWNNQIKQILGKMGRSMAMVRQCQKYMPGNIKKMIVESLVLSHLDYCATIWSNTTESNLNKLQIAQNKAARLALNCPFTTSITTMHHQLGWLSVRGRIKYLLINLIHNIIINKRPEILYSNLCFFSDVHQHSTRQSSESRFLLPSCRSGYGQGRVQYRAMVAWNSLPQYLVKQINTNNFSKRLRLFIFTQQR